MLFLALFPFGLERLLLVFLHPLVGLSPVSTLLSLFHSQVDLFQPSLGLFFHQNIRIVLRRSLVIFLEGEINESDYGGGVRN